jgi:predicted AlkP superfamily phosphohydrolase/phosphomutase
VRDFRTDEKQRLIDEVYEMTRRRFKAFRHFLAKDEFDFAMMVEMGIDRFHHGFWRYFDTSHRLYEPGNPYENVIRDYYKYVDQEVGRTLDALPPETSVMVVSDHGAKTMVGAICINEWLIHEGYLTLREQPMEPTRLTTDMIDWSRTVAWGEGGYYSRLFMNVAGREPEGIVPREDYDQVRDEIKAGLEALQDEAGRCINTKALKPEDVYRNCNGIPPDLIVYLGNLDWRSAGSVGTGSIYIYENDTGPDDANHAEDGIFIWHRPEEQTRSARSKYSIYDIAPSILTYYGIDPPDNMIGSSII